MTPKMVIFVNLLSLIAPTVWVVAAGALGFSIGKFGPSLLKKFKNDSFTNPVNSTNAAKVSQRSTSRRPPSAGKAKPSPPTSIYRGKRTSAR